MIHPRDYQSTIHAAIEAENVVRIANPDTLKSNETPVEASAPSNKKHKVTYA